MLSKPFIWPLTLLHICLTVLGTKEFFEEKLSIRNLQDGRVTSKFTFTTLLQQATPRDPRTLDVDDQSAQHYTLFPLALGQILREYGVTEVHLTLNAGNWDYDRWGYPEEKGVGTGAELWAWIGDGPTKTVDKRWKGLRNALSGLFCASLDSLDELRTTSPSQSFTPEGILPTWMNVTHHVRHASLPSEHVCTENLTPFIKLLPCKSLSGIASLMNPHRLFDADWHGMGIHVSWREDKGVELRLAFQSVFDPLRSKSVTKQDWSIESLFNRTIDRNCPVAQTSEIVVSLPGKGEYSITPEPSLVTNNLAIFDVNSREHLAPFQLFDLYQWTASAEIKPLNVKMSWPEAFEYPMDYYSESIPFSVKRTLRSSSQASGQLSVAIVNHRSTPVQALYLETMPWLLQFYVHSLEARVDGVVQEGIISNLTYIPSVPHSRPTTFQVLLDLPPWKTIYITMDVTKAFLRYTEHPPDAQRGWDLPPAVFTPVELSSDGHSFSPTGARIYTSILLVDLAAPDFSMPYNVIIFTCTLIAFIFGSIFNLLMRKFVVVRIASEKWKDVGDKQ